MRKILVMLVVFGAFLVAFSAQAKEPAPEVEAGVCCPSHMPYLRNSTNQCWSSYSDCHNTNGGGWYCLYKPC